MMRTKQLFKTRLLFFAALCCLGLAAVSCANEDIAQNNTGSDNDKKLTAFVAGEPTKTRTSIDYNTGDFYWEEGDRIYVKDDDGTLQASNVVDAAHAHSASFSFMVPGKFNNSATYKVYYLGKGGSGNQVTIPTAQTQTKPNTTEHLGELGDYGTATASGVIGGGTFHFQLEHQATILVFQPYTSNTILKNCYLTKVEVNSDDDIAETYTIDPVTGNLTSSAGSKQIILTTKDPVAGSTNENGFPLTNTSASVTTNGAYMLIKPGVHTFKVRYWIKDIATNVEGTITKNLGSFDYKKNTYYDMTANLNVRDYDGDHYYMWDAQQQYWYGYEWTHKNPAWQPTLSNNLPGATTSSFYPQNNTDSRWYNEGGGSGRFDATKSCFNLPNTNMMLWYAFKGKGHWDAEELWTTMNHLYKGGMWFLKKGKIASENSTTIGRMVAYNPWNQDSRGTNPVYSVIPIQGQPAASEIGDYFYLPALGEYASGKLYAVGNDGFYWSSSADTPNNAICLYFNPGLISINTASRGSGGRILPLLE